MGLFIITLLSIWLFPILAIIGSRTSINKKIISTSLGSAAVILICIITGVSTRSDELDCFLFFTLYFSLSTLLLYFYSFKHQLVKILSAFILICILAIGYISGSVGVLGVGLILNDYKVKRTIFLTNNIVYKQYNLGSAPGDYRGIKTSIVKRPFWLPGLEYRTFSKTYDRDYFKDRLTKGKNPYPTLYSDDFDVKFNASNKTIILMDTVKADTIYLK